MRRTGRYKKIKEDSCFQLRKIEDKSLSVDVVWPKLLSVIFFCLLLSPSISSKTTTQRPVYQTADSITICRLLNEARRQPASTNIPLFFARKFIGIPYVAHTLEREGDERLVVNTRQLDCTTLVETVTALTQCVYRQQYTWQAYLKALTAMRYRGGVIDRYPSRIHYFTEWITQNSKTGLVTEIQAPNPPFTAVQTVSVNYMSNHPDSYQALRQHPEYVGEIRRMEQRVTGQKFRYIPKTRVGRSAELRQSVRDGDIIAITCKKAGLDIAHLGFAVWKNGNLHLLNASQLHKRVVEEPMTLWQYLRQHPSHTGIRIIRINQ